MTRLALAATLVWLLMGESASASQMGPSGGASEATVHQAEHQEPPRRGRVEVVAFDNAVNRGLGHWYGGGANLYYEVSPRISVHGEWARQTRPGESEQLLVLGAWLRWFDWLSTQVAASGGGPNDPSAFFPRFRYDATAHLRTPVPGVLATVGYTGIYFGRPVRGQIIRAGAILYRGKLVLQGSVNFYNSEPGNLPSKSGSGSAQYGSEREYWVGLSASAGREAWQTQGVAPLEAQFTGYAVTAFYRKWLTPSFGMAGSYTHFLKREAYRYNGAEMRFFWEF